jgi:hypothetical protein
LLANDVETKEELKDMKKEISVFSSMLEHVEIKAIPPDTSRFEELLDNWSNTLGKALETFPKKHSVRVLLFPEENTVDYLKKLWKVSLVWVLFIVIALSLYRLCDKWLEKSYAVNQYKNAWESVYNQVDKKSKKMMDQELKKYYE